MLKKMAGWSVFVSPLITAVLYGNYYFGYHLYPHFAHLLVVLLEPMGPVTIEKPRWPVVIEVEPQRGQLICLSLS